MRQLSARTCRFLLKQQRGYAGRSAGYTFFEIIFVLSLVLLVLFLIAPKLNRGDVSRTAARGAAMQLLEDLRYLRNRAVASGIPCALVIPSDDQALGSAREYAMKEGQLDTKTIKVVNFENLYHNALLFVGTWNLDSSKLHDPALTTSAAPIKTYANNTGFDVGIWGGGKKDYIFLFTPEGKLLVNGNMPHFDNNYHIVVGESISYSPGSVPPGGGTGMGYLSKCYALTGVSTPVYTVEITPGGEVSLSEGVTALPMMAYQGGSDPGVGARIATAAEKKHAPYINDVQILPPINRDMYPESTGMDGIVEEGGHLSYVVKAEDQDGDPLTLNARGTNFGPRGTFSHTGQAKMIYKPFNPDDPEDTAKYGTSKGAVSWYPPAGAKSGDTFTHSIEVRDKEGLVARINKAIEVVGKWKIAFDALSYLDGSWEIYVMNYDGTGVKRLTATGYDIYMNYSPALSPDGNKIAYVSNFNFNEEYNDEIYTMNADGTDIRRITDKADEAYYSWDPCWSPDGSQIAFVSDRNPDGMFGIYIVNADGSHPVTKIPNEAREVIQKDNIDFYWPSWSPDGKTLIFSGDNWDDWTVEIYGCNVDGSNFRKLTKTDDWGWCYAPHWSPDGKKIVFDSDVDWDNDIFVLDDWDSGAPTRITATGNPPKVQKVTDNDFWDFFSCFSPDGKRMLVTSDENFFYTIYSMNTDGTDMIKLTSDDLDCYWSSASR